MTTPTLCINIFALSNLNIYCFLHIVLFYIFFRDKIGERVKSAVIRLKQCLSQSTGPKLQHYFLPSINIMAGINEDQRLLIIGKLEKFLKNLEAEVSKLNGSAKCTAQKKVTI